MRRGAQLLPGPGPRTLKGVRPLHATTVAQRGLTPFIFKIGTGSGETPSCGLRARAGGGGGVAGGVRARAGGGVAVGGGLRSRARAGGGAREARAARRRPVADAAALDTARG